jgi:hypothetical protein
MFINVCRLEAGAEFAFEWAVKNYCKPNDVLHLLHVQRTTDDVASQVEHKTEAAAQALLRMFLDRASLAKVICLYLPLPMRS